MPEGKCIILSDVDLIRKIFQFVTVFNITRKLPVDLVLKLLVLL